MKIENRIAVVTGAAGGIGRALARALAANGAAAVICADIDGHGADRVADEIGGHGLAVDVASESAIRTLVDTVETRIGPIDLFCSNAGILATGGPDADNADWQRSWDINVMAHVWAARHLVDRMIGRGGGYLLNTASAAGLLNQVGAAPYGVTKHAAVGLAEWLAMTYGDQGISVSVVCPQAVRSDMLSGHEDGVAALDGILEPEDVATACIDGIRNNRFLILPHPQVMGYMRAKTDDYERWLNGMRRLNRRYGSSRGQDDGHEP